MIDCKNTPDTTYKYFLYDPEGDGFIYFPSAEKRDEMSKSYIQQYLIDGWDEQVENIVAGEMTHTCQQVNRVDRPSDEELDSEEHDDDGSYWGQGWDYICDYALKQLGV